MVEWVAIFIGILLTSLIANLWVLSIFHNRIPEQKIEELYQQYLKEDVEWCKAAGIPKMSYQEYKDMIS